MKKLFVIAALLGMALTTKAQEQNGDLFGYWELAQELPTADDARAQEINLQMIELLYPLWVDYDKKANNDVGYEQLSIRLIGLFIATEQYNRAETILQKARDEIKNGDEISLIMLMLEEAEIAVAREEYDEAERLFENIAPSVGLFFKSDYLQSLSSSKIIDALNILLSYDSVSDRIQAHYIDSVSAYCNNDQWEEAIWLLEGKEQFFTSVLLTNERRRSINDIHDKLGLPSSFHIITEEVDAKVYYFTTLGTCYMRLGSILEADRYFYIGEQVADEDDTISIRTLAHHFLTNARFYNSMDNYARARHYFSKCFEICSRYDDDDLRATLRRALAGDAVLNAKNGFVEEAQSTTNSLFSYYLNNNLTETVDFINLVAYIVQIATMKEDFEEVQARCELAIQQVSLMEELSEKQTYYAIFYNALANAQCELTQYETAEKTLVDLGEANFTSNSYYTLAKIQHKQKKFTDAINSLKLCLETQSDNEAFANRLNLYVVLLTSAIEAKQAIDITTIADSFLSLFDDLTSITTANDREDIIPVYQTYYGAFLYYCDLFETNLDTAYDLSLSMKGAMLQSDIDFRDRVYATQNNDLIGRYEHLNSLEQTRRETAEEDESELLAEEIYYKERELIHDLSIYDSGKSKKTWREVQSALPYNGVAIEFVNYIVSEESVEYAALLLRKGWDAPKMVSLFEKSELDKLTAAGIAKTYSGHVGKQIAGLIWGQLEEFIDEGDNVYFSPSGVLHHLAIESLPTEDNRLMSERYNLYRLSSTKQLCYDHPAPQYDKVVLYGGLTYDLDEDTMVAESRAYTSARDMYAMRGFEADSLYRDGWRALPGTKREVENISTALARADIQNSVFEGQAGNEESFRTLSGQQNRIIHIATHGFFLPLEEAREKDYFSSMNDNVPEADNSMRRSGLMLAGGNRAWRGESVPDGVEDGVLTSQEIVSLDLRGADLVVLSACETGLGEVTGEGVFGLQRAFKKAGAQTLVMSLWRVSDAATEVMMSEFYTNLLAGKSKRESFLAAQAAVRSKFSEPYYWAAFIMLD